MEKTLFISNAKVSRDIISIIKERNKYFVETKEESQEYYNYNIDIVKWYYDNLDQVEDFLNSLLNNNTFRGQVYHVSIVCNNDIVEICIQYSYNYQDESDTDIDVVSDSELKDIIVKIMSKVSSLDIYYNYMVIIQAVYAKNITRIYTYKEGTTMFNSLLYKISPINIKDVEYIKKEILEQLIVSDRLLPKDKRKTVFIYDGPDYKCIEINSSDIDRVRIMRSDFCIDRGLCYTVNSLDDESKESILEDFMKLF